MRGCPVLGQFGLLQLILEAASVEIDVRPVEQEQSNIAGLVIYLAHCVDPDHSGERAERKAAGQAFHGA